MGKEALPIPLFNEIRQQRIRQKDLDGAIELIPSLQEQLADFVRNHVGIPQFEGFDGLRRDSTGFKDSPALVRTLQDWEFENGNVETVIIDKKGENKLHAVYMKNLPKPIKITNRRAELRSVWPLVVSPTIISTQVPDRAIGPIAVTVSSSGYPYGEGDDKLGIIYTLNVEGIDGDIEIKPNGVERVKYESGWRFDTDQSERRDVLERYGSPEVRGIMNLVDRLGENDILITAKKRRLHMDRAVPRFDKNLKFSNQEELLPLASS